MAVAGLYDAFTGLVRLCKEIARYTTAGGFLLQKINIFHDTRRFLMIQDRDRRR